MPRSGASKRGTQREADISKVLERLGWVTVDGGYVGPVDIIAFPTDEAVHPCDDDLSGEDESRDRGPQSEVMRKGPHMRLFEVRQYRAMLVEVKSVAKNPYVGFRQADRTTLSELAVRAQCEAMLAWWPPRGALQWVPESDWPKVKVLTM